MCYMEGHVWWQIITFMCNNGSPILIQLQHALIELQLDSSFWLPNEYYAHSFLLRLATKIDSLIKLDESTLQTTKGKNARMSVEIDLSQPLLSKYRLHCQIRRIEYEGIHQVCFSYDCYSYTVDNCSSVGDIVVAPMGGVHPTEKDKQSVFSKKQ